MRYTLATINGGGYIRLLGRGDIVHRETRDIPSLGVSCFEKIAEAKELLKEVKGFACRHCGNRDIHSAGCGSDSHLEHPICLVLTKQGGVEAIYVFKTAEEKVKKLLKIWSGCYGNWPVKVFNG